MNKFLVIIVGPTAVGKTSCSINVAKRLQCEIVSADSRQFYREMELGTAKPNSDELQAAKHHFVNNLAISDNYSAAKFEQDALSTIETLHAKSPWAVMVGGSGLYIKAITDGIDLMPDISASIRNQVNQLLELEGLEGLLHRLAEIDPAYYHQVDHSNPARVKRGLEVFMESGKPFSAFHQKQGKTRPFQLIKVGLNMDRENLYERIDLRMDQMLKAGLFEEAKQLYHYRDKPALNTVGYKEIFGYLDGEYDWEETVRLLKRNSRRYAKRQITWFKKDEGVSWFHPNDLEGICQYIEAQSGMAI